MKQSKDLWDLMAVHAAANAEFQRNVGRDDVGQAKLDGRKVTPADRAAVLRTMQAEINALKAVVVCPTPTMFDVRAKAAYLLSTDYDDMAIDTVYSRLLLLSLLGVKAAGGVA